MNDSVAIIACLKEEELYIREWLDWHIKIGVDHFYLCDNNDKDYEPKLQDVIQDYVDQGIVEIFDYSGVHPIQPFCYDDIFQRCKEIYDWWLVIDIDEFLVLPAFNDNLKEYISFIPNYVNMIYIMWRNYGDSGHLKYSDEPCMERFTIPDLNEYGGGQTCGKTLFRGSLNIEKIVSQHTITRKFKKHNIFFYPIGINGSDNTKIDIYRLYKFIYNGVYLKHFRTKTLEEWSWRYKRGDTLRNNDDKNYPYKIHKFWNWNTKTPEREKYMKELRKELNIE